eukprot:UN28145
MNGNIDRGYAVCKQHSMTCFFGKIKSHHECTEKIQHLRQLNPPKSFAYLKRQTLFIAFKNPNFFVQQAVDYK